MICRVGCRIPLLAPNRATLLRPRNCCITASNTHHPEINPNWIKVKVTGYLNAINICFAELFDRALDMYHSKQRKMNFNWVGENESRSLTFLRRVGTEER